jgi:hypothetical protein
MKCTTLRIIAQTIAFLLAVVLINPTSSTSPFDFNDADTAPISSSADAEGLDTEDENEEVTVLEFNVAPFSNYSFRDSVEFMSHSSHTTPPFQRPPRV